MTIDLELHVSKPSHTVYNAEEEEPRLEHHLTAHLEPKFISSMRFCKMLLSRLIFPFMLIFAGVHADSASSKDVDWTGYGGDIFNNRWAEQNTQISSSNVKSLVPECQIPGSVSATPVTLGNIVYFPTWTGSFIALDYVACQIVWKLNVTDVINQYAPITALQAANVLPVSRTSPQIDGNVLYFGTQTSGLVVAVDRKTGKLLGTIKINKHPLAIITQSPTFYKGKLFVGTSSVEETVASTDPSYKCCSFVGNVVALTFDPSSGGFKVAWNISMISDAQVAIGWSGAAVWGSQPSIDQSRGQVFIATGNSYTLPQAILDCQLATENLTAVEEGLVGDPCLPRSLWQESVLAIDTELGIVNWVQQLPALDAWTLACGIPGLLAKNPTSCPQTPGPDSDFGMAPSFVAGSGNTPYGKDVVVVGQKNGILYAMSAQAGRIFWSTATSPGSVLGGLSWGIATDDSNVYFTAINGLAQPWTLEPSGQATNHSAYGAASLKDGTLLWEVAVPDQGIAFGPPSVVGDLVLVARAGGGSLAAATGNGSIIALKKDSGKLVANFAVVSTPRGGVAIRGKTVLFGSGYNDRADGSLYVWQLGGSS